MDERYPGIYAAGDVMEVDHVRNARSATEQAQVAAENICRQIRGEQQQAYRSAWWEGATKLTLGIVSTSLLMLSRSVVILVYHDAHVCRWTQVLWLT